MFKVAVIGAGSISFTREIVKDLLCVSEFKDTTIALTDISEQNLQGEVISIIPNIVPKFHMMYEYRQKIFIIERLKFMCYT